MKLEDYNFSKMPQEVIDFKDSVSTILNFGKYSAPVLTARPNWKGREGEHCYAYIANTGGATGYDFYTYFWINSGWIYMQWLAGTTNLYYETTTSIPVWSAVLNPIIALSDRSIESIKIALGAIGSDNMALNSIYTEALSVGAVTATKIGSNAIITGHLSANCVTATAISSTVITADKIAANAITSTKIAAQSILAAHLTAGELVTLSAQIKDAIITSAKIGSLDVNKLTAGTMAAIDFVISTAGNIRSENYIASSSGFKLDGNTGLEINTGTFPGSVFDRAYTAGAYLDATAATARSTSSTSWTKLKEMYINRGGTITVKFDGCKTGGDGHTSEGVVARNGVAVGTIRNFTTALPTYTTYSEDISGWKHGDAMQVYGRRTGGTADAYAKNLSLYTNSPTLPVEQTGY